METSRLMTSLTILVVYVIFIPQITSLLLDGNGVVKPDDPYVYFGQTLTLWCNLTNPRVRENSSSMYFMFNNERVPKKYIHIINTRSIQLRYPVTVEKFGCPNKLKRHNFICNLDKVKSSPEPLGHQLIQVNYEPKPITNFKCHVYNWENMTCTWDLATPYCNYDDVEVSLVWTIDRDQYDCPNLTKTSCSWLPSGNMLHPDMLYYMVVLIRNKKYNNTNAKSIKSEMFRIPTRDIVQPAPVEKFKVVRPKNNSTCLLATWSNKLIHRHRKYKVEVSSDDDEVPKMMLFNNQSHYEICNLRPYTLYTVSVSNIPMPDGHTTSGIWSDTVQTVVRTSQDIPDAAPVLCPGCFTQRVCEEINCQRNIQLYWKPVEKKHQNGIITGYKIETFSETDGETTTYFIDNGGQTSYSLSLTSTSEYLVTITAGTIVGYSKQASSIIIPAISDIPYPVDNMIVETANTNTNLYIIQWSDNNKQEVYNYTLYYCQRLDATTDCKGEVSWIQLSSQQLQYKLKLDDDSSTSLYHIGISRELNYQGFIQSSGIRWNKCIYIQNTKPVSAPPNVRFSDLQPDKGLLIEWDRLDCSDNTAYIKNYRVQICPVANRNDLCKGHIQNITVPNYSTNYRIDNLQPFTRYKVVIQAVSKAGIGPSSAPISIQVADSSLKTAEIVGIVIGALFVLALMLFAVFRCIKCARAEKKKCENINISNFLPETMTNSDFTTSKSNQHSGRFTNRPLPPPPSILGVLDGEAGQCTDSGYGYEVSVAQYEPVGPERPEPKPNPRKGNDSITSETLLINNMESQDTSPYAISDVTKGQCDDETYHSDSDVKIDSYTKVGISDSSCSCGDPPQPPNDLNNPITPQTVHTVGMVLQHQNVPAVRPRTILNQCLTNKKLLVPQIIPTENSDSSDDYSGYIPNQIMTSPVHEKHPIVCELVSPSGDIHNTQTLLIRRRDPMRPLSEYLHQLPKEYFEDPNQDEPGPTTEL